MMDFFRKKVKKTKIEDKNLETEKTSTIIQVPQPNQITYSGFCYNIQDCPANKLCLKQQNDCLLENSKHALTKWAKKMEEEKSQN